MATPSNFKDLTGMRFGKLTVKGRTVPPKHITQRDKLFWLCICDCGNERKTTSNELNKGRVTQCKECRRNERDDKRGYTSKNLDRLRRIWDKMKRRCYDINEYEYFRYGGVGIKVSERWMDFNNFRNDMMESYLKFAKDNGEKNTTIDRINSKGNYELNNCRWATYLEQARNRSDNISVEVNGIKYGTISELAEDYWLDYHLVHARYKAGKTGYDLIRTDNIENYDPNKRYDSNRRIVYKNAN